MVSISLGKSAADWKNAVIKDGMKWTNLIDVMDFDGKCAKQYGNRCNTYLCFDRPSGKVVMQTVNEINNVRLKIEGIFNTNFTSLSLSIKAN